MKEKLITLYYHLTAYIPRKLPQNEIQFMRFRDIMLKYYHLKDEAQTYHVISGQIQSTPGHLIRKSYGHIANQVKRVKINALAQCFRVAAMKEMEHQLNKLMEAEAEKITQEQGLANGDKGESVSNEVIQGPTK